MGKEILHIVSYLQAITSQRLESYFGEKGISSFPDFELSGSSPLSNFLNHYNLSKSEIVLLISALTPHILPGFFDKIIQKFLPNGGDFPEFGGVKLDHHRGMIPTGETVLFLLAGMDIQERLSYFSLFDQSNPLIKHHIISLNPVKTGEPRLGGTLVMDSEYVEVFTSGKISLPTLSINFPAEHLQTEMTWEDLVLPEQVWNQINELQIWLKHKESLLTEFDLGRKIKPGYRALFYGPPGTGKTVTATLLGKYTGREVFRIDLSMIVSKYIGETEKNLSALFDKAENKDWILFFDEADAIFGKRTGVRDAHDKYANQEVSYLLQRIESYNGLVILASNFRNNIDSAFVRRFNSMVYFPSPRAEDRLLIWEKSLPKQFTLAKDVAMKELAETYDLTGSHIINIIQYISLASMETQDFVLKKELLIKGIKREMEKEGK
ncbi:ATP-binding protein [Algoriphagus sp. D3-2-R+10]|uniref:ATP-binding protein n=1 Tax=Algoriphagus aurantiacus TaxID=3103948 RepID=UPI002B3D0B43|nr:ATP-binding protein [Algoriphagus sp. D3-2-R+10]MEB2773761.1 ATP-binding protein [Algoriphagus sp. D3-2-R+10]